jgi:hypothetical protein
MPAPKNNRNATKKEAEKASTWVQVRCTEAEKEAWKRRAKKARQTLSEWVKKKLTHN